MSLVPWELELLRRLFDSNAADEKGEEEEGWRLVALLNMSAA